MEKARLQETESSRKIKEWTPFLCLPWIPHKAMPCPSCVWMPRTWHTTAAVLSKGTSSEKASRLQLAEKRAQGGRTSTTSAANLTAAHRDVPDHYPPSPWPMRSLIASPSHAPCIPESRYGPMIQYKSSGNAAWPRGWPLPWASSHSRGITDKTTAKLVDYKKLEGKTTTINDRADSHNEVCKQSLKVETH